MAYEGANAAPRACLARREIIKAVQVLNVFVLVLRRIIVERTNILESLRQLSSNRFAETGVAQADGSMLPLDNGSSIYFRI